jgi:hypothetical protein
MSSSQYFSNHPRGFEHQKIHPHYPLELSGKSKRINSSTSSLGKWDVFMSKSPESTKSFVKNRPLSQIDSQRTIVPAKNVGKIISFFSLKINLFKMNLSRLTQ